MAIPTKKIYGRNGKLIFDPNNPKDVENYKKRQPLMEAFNLVQGLTDPRGGGGLFGMAKKVSKAIAKETVKKVAKSTTKSTTKRSPKKITTTESKVEKPNLTLENLKKALNPSSGLPGPLPKVTNNKSVSTSSKSLTSNTPKNRTSQKTLPAGEESKAVIKTAAPKVRTLSDFMKQQSEVITPLLPDVKSLPFGSTKLPKINNVFEQQAKANASRKIVNNVTRNVEVPKTSNTVPFPSMKDVLNRQSNPLGLKLPFDDAVGKFRIGDSKIAASQIDNVAPKVATEAAKDTKQLFGQRPTFGPYSSRTNILSEVVTGQKDVYKNLRAKAAEKAKEIPKVPKDKLDTFSKLVLGTAGLGIAGGIGYQGYKGYQGLTSKPTDLNNINENDLRDSKVYKDVKILKTSTGDKGIIKDPATGKWKYFDEKKGVRLPKGKVGLGDVPPIGLGDKTNTGGGGTGGGTKPRSTTGQAFDKAFAEARKQAGGAGGIFEWNGKKYGTALVGETVPKDRVEVGKTTTPLMGDEYYKKDPRLATLRQQDDDRQLLARAEAQKKEMKEFKPTESLDVLPVPTKPLSSLMFKTSSLNPQTGSRVEPISYNTIDTVDTKSKKLRKKSYGGNLAMLKYMK